MAFTHYQLANGHIEITYDKDGFISIKDILTNQSVKFHHTVINIIAKTKKENLLTSKNQQNENV